MKSYQNKGIRSWNKKDTEKYFRDILSNTQDQEEKFRVVTSKDLSDDEDLNMQRLIAEWYFKENLERKDNFLEDLFKTIKLHTLCQDFLIEVYVPIGKDDMFFGMKFQGIAIKNDVQVAEHDFHNCMLIGLNKYLTNNEKAKSMIIVKGFNQDKSFFYVEDEVSLPTYEKEVFHFAIEDGVLHSVDVENIAKIEENDLTTNEYLGKQVGVKYIDTCNIVANFEVEKFIQELGLNFTNQK